MQVEIERYHSSNVKKGSAVPLTITWQNAKMIRNHSFRACAKEVLNVNRGIEVVKVNLIGPPSTGKSTAAESLAHLLHTLSDTPYIVKKFKRDDLIDMENTLSKLQPINHILIFDDISWLSAGNAKNKLDQIQKTFTEIRHISGGIDVRIIIIFCFHYNMSIPKHLRQADFFMYLAIGSSELENTQKIVGVKNTAKLIEFKRVYQESISTGKLATATSPEVPATFSYRLPGKGNTKFSYFWRKPFGPALWWNNDSLRHIVFPARSWIQPICSICTGSIESTPEEIKDLDDFERDILEQFPIGIIRQGLRVKLLQHGINTWEPRVKQVMAYFDKYGGHKLFNLEDLAARFNLTVKNTQLHKKLPDHILHPETVETVQP